MNLVVDTSVWSLVLRRSRVDEDHPLVRAFRAHIQADDGIFLVGHMLQELLDGLRSQKDADRLLRLLEPFPLLSLERGTYVAAACIQHGYPLLTADRDFLHIADHSELMVLP